MSFDLPQPCDASVTVYDLGGRMMRTLWSGALEAGQHRVDWDGRDERGQAAPTGVYLVRLETANGFVRSQKMTLAK